MFPWVFWTYLRISVIQVSPLFVSLSFSSSSPQCPPPWPLPARQGLDLARPVSAPWGPEPPCQCSLLRCSLLAASLGWLCWHGVWVPWPFLDHVPLPYSLTFLHVTAYPKVLCLRIYFLLYCQPCPLDCKFPASRNYVHIASAYLF